MAEILYEDNHLIAAYKKSGQTVQPEPGKPLSLEEEVKAYIKQTYQKEGDVFLGVIHRLDMPVEGVVLFARTSKALARMNELFQKREVDKEYEAWVENTPALTSGTIIHWLKRDENKNFTKAFTSLIKGADEAKLSYTVLSQKGKFTRLRIKLFTGRKHQIRAQLSAIGHPIVGDRKYGSNFIYPNGAIALQSCLLAFIHPVKNEMLNIQCEGILQFPLPK